MFPSEIHTDRLILRKIKLDHTKLINEVMRNSFVQFHPWLLNAEKPQTMEETQEMVQDVFQKTEAKSQFWTSIFLKPQKTDESEEKFIGNIFLTDLDPNLEYFITVMSSMQFASKVVV